jgi:hypothetical protein
MAGAVGKMDGIMGGILPQNIPIEAHLVTTESPESHSAQSTSAMLLIFIWRPRRDSNPCYRRERAVSWAGLDDRDFVRKLNAFGTFKLFP